MQYVRAVTVDFLDDMHVWSSDEWYSDINLSYFNVDLFDDDRFQDRI